MLTFPGRLDTFLDTIMDTFSIKAYSDTGLEFYRGICCTLIAEPDFPSRRK
jgi:hypothetical protein